MPEDLKSRRKKKQAVAKGAGTSGKRMKRKDIGKPAGRKKGAVKKRAEKAEERRKFTNGNEPFARGFGKR